VPPHPTQFVVSIFFETPVLVFRIVRFFVLSVETSVVTLVSTKRDVFRVFFFAGLYEPYEKSKPGAQKINEEEKSKSYMIHAIRNIHLC
jgi:hypothetical protein